MNNLSKKKEARNDMFLSVGNWVLVYIFSALIAFVPSTVYFNEQKNYYSGEINTPVGTYTPQQIEQIKLPNYNELHRTCNDVLNSNKRAWYPRDLREGCQNLFEREYADEYTDIRKRLRAYEFIQE